MFTNDRLIERIFRTVHNFNLIWWHPVFTIHPRGLLHGKRMIALQKYIKTQILRETFKSNPWYTESIPWAIIKKTLKSHPEILPEIQDLFPCDTISIPLAPVYGKSPLGNWARVYGKKR
jgi:hypothetical protein